MMNGEENGKKKHQSQSSSSLCFESKLLAIIQYANVIKRAQNMEFGRSREHFFVFKGAAFICLGFFLHAANFTQKHSLSWCYISQTFMKCRWERIPITWRESNRHNKNAFRSHLMSLPSCSTALNRRSEGLSCIPHP